ncbi:male-specific protein scotti [Drosophila pseudoobscura]|uniref:male-specific protein scotti n=1 Tax=Drosophila pseudoobscura TaxID=7237 RepID=UPI00143F8DAC|nr:male-specific protein scotti [Drosophila pseudoobscura]
MDPRMYRLIRLPSYGLGNNNNDPNQQRGERQRQPHPDLGWILDAPNEPPRNRNPLLYLVTAPPRPRKKRSFMTTSKPFRIQTNVSDLQYNAWQAIQDAPPEKRCEYYVKYMDEHMNSQNYPNGVGLPHRWGQF